MAKRKQQPTASAAKKQGWSLILRGGTCHVVHNDKVAKGDRVLLACHEGDAKWTPIHSPRKGK